MGHLGHLKQEYRDLVERLAEGPVAMPEPRDPEAHAGWREILEILYTPEEAALAARLPLMPSSLKKIAARVAVAPDELAPKLDAMADKGLVLDLVHPDTGKVLYLLSPPVVGFFEFSLMRAHDSVPKKRIATALSAYTHGDPTFAQEVFGHGTVVGRALAHETTFDDDLPDVLDWERATAVIEEADRFAVALCYCRHKAEHNNAACDAPMDNCLSLGGGADFIIRRGFGREIERNEALDILARSRESGLVQIADNVQQQPTYICNCCACCCGQLTAINEFDLPAVNPSGFLPANDLAKCSGCSRCARACPVTAISMLPERTPSKRKTGLIPRLDEERCIGCGVCATACKKDSMHMHRRKQRSHVPLNSVERVVRQAIETGRLGHLLFDGGESLGSRFLAGAVRALHALPGAQQLMASEQVASRFVAFALNNIENPIPPQTPRV